MEKDKFFQMRVSPEWLEKLDRWRFKQIAKEKRDIPRAEAVRLLVERGYQADKA